MTRNSPPKLGGVASRTAKRELARSAKRDSAQPQEIGRSLKRSERRRGGSEWEPPRLASLGTPPNLRVLQNYGIAGSVLTVAALYERRFSQNQRSTGGHRPPLQQTKTALRQFCNTLNLGEELLFLAPRTGKRLDDGVSETRICKFGLIADALSRCGKQPRRQRFVPTISEPRDVSKNFCDLLLRYVARKRQRVHSTCANRGIR